MKFLADAHISRSMVGWLESQGHEVLRAAALAKRLSDSAILRISNQEERIVLTSDKDFGELCFRRLIPSSGVILLRLSAPTEAERLDTLIGFWPAIVENVAGHFVVVTDKAVRRRPLPTAKTGVAGESGDAPR